MREQPEIMIVANKDLMRFARRLSHGISQITEHSAGHYTLEQYKHSESGISGKQAIIFLGLNQIAKDYIDDLPEKFREHGTKCFFGGTRAILEIHTPQLVNRRELDALKAAVSNNKEDFRRTKEETKTKPYNEQRPSSQAVGFGLGLAIGGFLWSGVSATIATGFGLFTLARAYKMAGAYRRLQIDYVLSRFLKEEFDSYISEVERVNGQVFSRL